MLLFLVLLAILLEPAAATSPVADLTNAAAPMDPNFPDFDDVLAGLAGFCAFCSPYINQCICAQVGQTNTPWPTQPLPTMITVETIRNHPDFPQGDFPPPASPKPEPEPQYNYEVKQPLVDETLKPFREDATSVQHNTTQIWAEGIYNPLDRLLGPPAATERPRTPSTSNTRRKPIRHGYPCLNEQCDKVFDRDCDLKRHSKTHLPRYKRPHQCSFCDQGFQYPKDLKRHQRKHSNPESSPETLFYCPDCNASFPRRDNMLRHRRKQHSSSDTS